MITNLPEGEETCGNDYGGSLVFVSCQDKNPVYVLDLEPWQVVQKIETGKGADAMVCMFSSELE